MHITEFLKNINLNIDKSENHVICFKSSEFSFLFFNVLLNNFKSNLNLNHINIHDIEINALKAQLNQSFLGNNFFYWISDISEYKKSKELIDYLNNYKGPHKIGFFINDNFEYKFKYDTINFEYACSIDQFNQLIFLWPEAKQKIILFFIKKIFEKVNKINLDQLSIFAQYAILLGGKNINFNDNWLNKMLISDNSLFTLSKYFFAKEPFPFFKYLDSLIEDYQPVFWPSYWSEQLYRAFHFIQFRQLGKNLEAKQIAYKLPFSFIQNDWKKTSVNELQLAHDFISNVDFELKNGASDISLDLFYAKFFGK